MPEVKDPSGIVVGCVMNREQRESLNEYIEAAFGSILNERKLYYKYKFCRQMADMRRLCDVSVTK